MTASAGVAPSANRSSRYGDRSQSLREVERTGLDQLPHERPDRELRRELRRPRSGRDDEHVAVELARVDALPYLDAEVACPADELARHARRVGDAVRGARERAEHVVGADAVGDVDLLDRDAELSLHRCAPLERREAVRRRREEDVPDLEEERRAELLEEADAVSRETDLGRGRELLPHAAHRLRGRAPGHLAAVAEDDIA